MAGGIFLLKGDGELVEMKEHRYDSEELLQKLLATHPSLLAGDLMGATPRRWLLVAREAALPSEEAGAGRWSVDHLFLDQDAVPTIVEVKRSSDTRIRREVVGQMLEYAANVVLYWPVDSLQELFEETCQSREHEPQDVLAHFLGGAEDQETFWQRASTNMKAGRVRLVFVADQIPAELRRIVEFLSAQMSLAQVYALEIKQYVGQDLKTLVPRVYGGPIKPIRPPTPGWDEPSFFADLIKRHGEAAADVARRILVWAESCQLRIWWGRGAKEGCFIPMLDVGDKPHHLFSVWTFGKVAVEFVWMKTQFPFDADVKRKELRNRLNDVPGVNISLDKIGAEPSVSLAALKDGAALQKFLEAFDWAIQEIRNQA